LPALLLACDIAYTLRVRNVFLLLLFVNVVFFGWSRWVDRPRDAALGATRSVTALPALELTQGQPVPPGPAKPAMSPESATHCRSIGPFTDAAAATPTADGLRARGLQPRPRSVDITTPDGYWVYVEDLKDAAARRKVISTLNANGIKDAAAMADEAERVSVGVFADQNHAVHRAEQVRELGFKPVLSLHQKTLSNNWLDVDLKPNDADPIAIAPTAPPAANSKTEAVHIVDCPSKPAAS
jgi:hypothetical protein